MKKYIVTFALLVLIAACGTGNGKGSSSDSTSAATSAATDLSANPDYVKGLALIAKNDCLTCHKVDEKVIGPAYDSVANRYAGMDTAVTHLAHKIIHGGSGAWGTVNMTAHDSLSEADAEQMAKYVLLLKTK